MPRKKKQTDPTGLGERIECRMSRQEKDAFQAAARRQGITLSQWLRLAAWRIIHEYDGKVQLVEVK
jgi:uncharacterized protein (DUF1778 family)